MRVRGGVRVRVRNVLCPCNEEWKEGKVKCECPINPNKS